MKRCSFLLVIILISVLVSSFSSGQESPKDSSNSSKASPFSSPPPSPYGQEDLHSLQIDTSSLHPATPVAGDTGNFAEFTRELFEVEWRNGDPIDLYVIKPRGVAKPPVILYLYSYPSDTDRFRDNEYCKRLVADGYAAVGFVSAMTGGRYHDRPMREWFILDPDSPRDWTPLAHEALTFARAA